MGDAKAEAGDDRIRRGAGVEDDGFAQDEHPGLDLRPCGDLSAVSFKGAVMDGVTCSAAQARAIRASGPRSMVGVVMIESEPKFETKDARAAYRRA